MSIIAGAGVDTARNGTATASHPADQLLANIYGDDATSEQVCAETEVLAGEAADANGDIDILTGIADRLGFVAALPGGQCTVSFAGGGH